MNYDADAQKIYVRKNDAKCEIWGKPAKVIRARYIDANGKEKRSVLLYSGYWGVSRHFHYVVKSSLFALSFSSLLSNAHIYSPRYYYLYFGRSPFIFIHFYPIFMLSI